MRAEKSAAILFLHRLGYGQESGTERQFAGSGGGQVDVESHAAVVEQKGNHAAIAQEGVALSHGEDTGSEAGQNLFDSGFRTADIKDLTARGLVASDALRH